MKKIKTISYKGDVSYFIKDCDLDTTINKLNIMKESVEQEGLCDVKFNIYCDQKCCYNCGEYFDIDDISYELSGQREETDEEERERIAKEKKRKEATKKALATKEAIRVEKDKKLSAKKEIEERKLFEELKKKYGDK